MPRNRADFVPGPGNATGESVGHAMVHSGRVGEAGGAEGQRVAPPARGDRQGVARTDVLNPYGRIPF
jgi:hypothetical protein